MIPPHSPDWYASRYTLRPMKLLEQLALTPGVPGRELRVRKLIEKEIKGLFDEVRTDALGSLICVRKARPKASGGGAKSKSKPTKIMLAAHMDQIDKA